MNDNSETLAEWTKLQQEIRNPVQTMKNEMLPRIEQIEHDARMLVDALPVQPKCRKIAQRIENNAQQIKEMLK